MEASEEAGEISNTEDKIERDDYLEAVAGQIMNFGEVIDKEMDATKEYPLKFWCHCIRFRRLFLQESTLYY